MPWFPKNRYLWDFWFVRQPSVQASDKSEQLHVFYLQASHQASEWNPDLRHDLASVGHAVMTADGWHEVNPEKPALEKASGRAWDNLSIWTGCIIYRASDKKYLLYYTARSREDEPVQTPHEWQRPQHIGLATSTDLMIWQRTADCCKAPVIPNPGKRLGLDGVAWRDPYILADEEGTHYAFICARMNPADANNKRFGTDAGGAIVWLKSKSPEIWNVAETQVLIASDEFYQMEVPQCFWRSFEHGKRFYLIFCAQEKDCSRQRRARQQQCITGTYYLKSELLPLDYRGIPALNETAHVLARNWYAGRLLEPETTLHPFFFGFQWADEAGRFVGGISDPMPVEFLADGTIQLKQERE
jgi:beta-fructofuranosidase